MDFDTWIHLLELLLVGGIATVVFLLKQRGSP